MVGKLTLDTVGVGASPSNFTVHALGDSLGDSFAVITSEGSVTVAAATTFHSLPALCFWRLDYYSSQKGKGLAP